MIRGRDHGPTRRVIRRPGRIPAPGATRRPGRKPVPGAIRKRGRIPVPVVARKRGRMPVPGVIHGQGRVLPLGREPGRTRGSRRSPAREPARSRHRRPTRRPASMPGPSSDRGHGRARQRGRLIHGHVPAAVGTPTRAAAFGHAPGRIQAGTLALPTHPAARAPGSPTRAPVPIARPLAVPVPAVLVLAVPAPAVLVLAALQAVVRELVVREGEGPAAEGQEPADRAGRAAGTTRVAAPAGRAARAEGGARTTRAAAGATRGAGPTRTERQAWQVRRRPSATTSLIRVSRIGAAGLPDPATAPGTTPLAAPAARCGRGRNWHRPVLACGALVARLPAGAG